MRPELAHLVSVLRLRSLRLKHLVLEPTKNKLRDWLNARAGTMDSSRRLAVFSRCGLECVTKNDNGEEYKGGYTKPGGV